MNPNPDEIITRDVEAAQALLREDFRDEFKASLYLTAKKLLGYKDINIRTHGEMIRSLEDERKRKLIVMPRGTFKSTVGCVSYPIWRLMNDPNERILLDSEVYTNSKNFLRLIKAHLAEEAVTNLFGEFRTDSNWTEGEITIAQRTQPYKEASITASGVGAVKVGQHYTTIIGDDYNSNNNSQTREGRQKIIDHYRMNLAILEPGGTYVIIGTRYATDDVIGWILENEIGVRVEDLKA